ncbi:FxsB family cyclophane-forming radical SAM/SPASM peptide maturase [Nonomuraea sp. NPDC050536]|uniref:FxsB family cyclophane-forming radical SAM/SPASM peptide maturase n=1 Tax=Nonomuraea sp. NPDC050536 TaxID=3364366 RepID=UPI0037C958CA
MPEEIHISSPRRKEWPESGLRTNGFKALPFKLFIAKIHERCNLACTYCYMYEMADQSWRGRPIVMADETVEALAERISEHAVAHDLRSVGVTMHGGEPLLAGAQMIDSFARTIRTAVHGTAMVNFRIQTNGLLLDERMLDMLLRNDVRVGVSLDGGMEANDRSRKYRNGNGSYADVAKALNLLRSDRFRAAFSGILCTIDLRNDPVECYEALAEFLPPTIDFMLPHGNWTETPPGLTGRPSSTPYADWLIRLYEHWRANPRRTKIRVFQSIFQLLLGGPSNVDSLGLLPIQFVVVDTDGSLQQVDSLKSAFPGAPETGLNVFDHSFDMALTHPAVIARQMGVSGLCATCQTCEIRDTCGGGLYTHRYRSGSGFLNPSVYCADLLRLITHVRRDMRRELLGTEEPSDE